MIAARAYVEDYGFSILPIGENKKPLRQWKAFQTRQPTREEWEGWPRENLAIVTGQVSNIVVVDCESQADARWFWDNKGQTRMIVQTPRGFHLYFRWPGTPVRNAIRVAGRYDIRGDRGYVLAPPSIKQGKRYRWWWPACVMNGSLLPTFRLEWGPPPRLPPPLSPLDAILRPASPAAQRKLAETTQLRAISGCGGHNVTYRVACLLREAGLGRAEALSELQAWNRTNADPPWSDRELEHKIDSAFGA